MTQTLELPREDLKWELENRLHYYMPTTHRWSTAVIDEVSIQLEDNGAFQVEATCACAKCGTEVRLEIRLRPTQAGLLQTKPWTLHYLRPKRRPGACTEPDAQTPVPEPRAYVPPSLKELKCRGIARESVSRE